MNYLLYVLAAYTFTFVMLGVMFTGSYRRYRKAQSDYKAAITPTEQAQQ